MPAGQKFPSVGVFYLDDERRRASGECDFGCWWFDEDRCTYRVSAIKDTGEVYLLRQRNSLMHPAGEVEVLLTGLAVGTYDDAERILEGWAEACGGLRSLDWIRERCATYIATSTDVRRPSPGEPRFALGRTVITVGAFTVLGTDSPDVAKMIDRHVTGDWGDLDEEDRAMNDRAVEHDSRILSRYNLEQGSFYVITEWDRSVTTVLRVEDY